MGGEVVGGLGVEIATGVVIWVGGHGFVGGVKPVLRVRLGGKGARGVLGVKVLARDAHTVVVLVVGRGHAHGGQLGVVVVRGGEGNLG